MDSLEPWDELEDDRSMKPKAKDLAAERYESRQLKKGVPHAKAEKMERAFLRAGARSNRRYGRK